MSAHHALPQRVRARRLGTPWPLGIRAQLTLLYTAIFAVLFLAIGGGYYVYLERTLQSNFDTTLALRTQQIASGVSFENGMLSVQDVTGELPQNAASNASNTSDTGNSGHTGNTTSPTNSPNAATTTSNRTAHVGVTYGTLVRIVNAQGKVVYVSPAFRALQVPQTSVTTALAGHTWTGTLAVQGQPAVRLESVPLTDNNAVRGAVQVGQPLDTLHETLRTAAIALFGVVPVLLLLGAFTSFWLARRALLPVLRLTSAAREIEAHDLHRRVPVPPAHDEVRDLAETFNEMIARLERTFEQQRRFVADASHELRTPVAAIQSLTDVALLQPEAPQNYTHILREVNSEAQRLGHLIHELLALARADEGRLPIERERVLLDELAIDVLAVVEPLAEEHQLTVSLDAEQPVAVLGDAARLIQVLLNLVDNAIRYTPPGGTVGISITTDQREARIIVRDNGRGIGAQHLPHIFERFYRADSARSRTDGGSGLGLAIVDWVVRAHHGTIAVESMLGQGTTVTVHLPLATTVPTATIQAQSD